MMFGLSNIYITSFLKQRKLKTFDGVFSCDRIPPHLLRQDEACFISNLSRADEIGSHFITLVKQGQTVYILDSLALSEEIYPPELKKIFSSFSVFFVYTNALQEEASHFCGFYCIFFVLRFNKGRKEIKNFSHPNKNDQICIDNIILLIKNKAS